MVIQKDINSDKHTIREMSVCVSRGLLLRGFVCACVGKLCCV